MKTLSFSGYTWLVAESENKKIGSQDSYYSSSPQNVWVDEHGYLHLRATSYEEKWNGASVSLSQTLGYGIYNFFLVGRVDLLHENLLAALSLDTNAASKISIQFSQWTYIPPTHPYEPLTRRNNLRYATSDGDSHLTRMDLNGDYTTHRMIWRRNNLSFLSLHGHYEADPPPRDVIIQQYYLPVPPDSERERVTIRLSKRDEDGISTPGSELVIARFAFTPL